MRYPASGSLLALVVDDFFFGTQRRSAQVFCRSGCIKKKKRKVTAETRESEPDAFYRLHPIATFSAFSSKIEAHSCERGQIERVLHFLFNIVSSHVDAI